MSRRCLASPVLWVESEASCLSDSGMGKSWSDPSAASVVRCTLHWKSVEFGVHVNVAAVLDRIESPFPALVRLASLYRCEWSAAAVEVHSPARNRPTVPRVVLHLVSCMLLGQCHRRYSLLRNWNRSQQIQPIESCSSELRREDLFLPTAHPVSIRRIVQSCRYS